jgi:hypothetical protein
MGRISDSVRAKPEKLPRSADFFVGDDVALKNAIFTKRFGQKNGSMSKSW